jgi:hypothetical protein
MNDEVPPEVAQAKAEAARERGEKLIPIVQTPPKGVSASETHKRYRRSKVRRRMQKASRRANRR